MERELLAVDGKLVKCEQIVPLYALFFYMQSKTLYSLSLAGGVILYMYFSLYMKKLILNLYSSIKILICFDIERNIWKK